MKMCYWNNIYYSVKFLPSLGQCWYLIKFHSKSFVLAWDDSYPTQKQSYYAPQQNIWKLELKAYIWPHQTKIISPPPLPQPPLLNYSAFSH